MTKAEYGKIPKDYKMVQTAENSHRIRTTLKMYIPGYIPSQENDRWHRVCVFLTDQKVTEKPDPIEKQQVAPIIKTRPVYKPPARTEFDDLKDTLKEGIKTVSAPQLFPTPEPIAVKMVELAEIEPGHDVLEPSAGTGNLLKSLPCIRPNGSVTAIEINQNLKPYLEPWADNITIDDFLNCHEIGNFDRIIMNPPFSKASDIKHIKHAMTFLKPGGRLVALCANGPRQNEQLRPLADHWEVLPEGSFKQAGTNVNIALMVINN
jgi:phospholipid N-methyltransferase